MDNKAPTTIHFDRRYLLVEGIARNEMAKMATKKKIVSFVNNPRPTTNPATYRELGLPASHYPNYNVSLAGTTTTNRTSPG